MSSNGYAVKDVARDRIEIASVAGTRRAAIVNWLVTECGVWISNAVTDEQIERLWKLHKITREADVVQVEVREIQ